MTKQEFAAQHRIVQSRVTRRLGIAAAIGWGFILATMLCIRSVIKYIEEQEWAGSLRAYWVFGTAGLIIIAIGIAMLFLEKPEGVRCPKCGKNLAGSSANLVVFTGNCGFCGERVIDDSIVAIAMLQSGKTS